MNQMTANTFLKKQIPYFIAFIMATPQKTGAAFLFQFTANWAMENAAPFYFKS